MSTYDMIIQKGMEKGRQKTIYIIQNLLKRGFDIPTIIEIMGEDEDFIKDVIKGKIKK